MKKQETVAVQIRFPEDLYRAIKERAKKSRRSFNGETIASLELFFEIAQRIQEIKKERESDVKG